MTHARPAPSDSANFETDGHLIRWARGYDRLMTVLSLGREGRFRRAIVEAAGIEPGQRVLDVGCGTGTLALVAADHVGASGEVVGIDPSAAMIEQCRAKAAASSTLRAPVRFEVAGIERLPFEDASFDVVLSSLMFHHLPPHVQRAGLSEIARVLVPGGSVHVIDFPGGGPRVHRLLGKLTRHGRHGHGGHADPRQEHRLEGVTRAAEELGFEDVAVEPFRPRFLRHLSARTAAAR